GRGALHRQGRRPAAEPGRGRHSGRGGGEPAGGGERGRPAVSRGGVPRRRPARAGGGRRERRRRCPGLAPARDLRAGRHRHRLRGQHAEEEVVTRAARLALAAAAAAVAALVISMIAGGAAFPRVILGVPTSGVLTRWGLPVSKLAMDVAGLATVGLLDRKSAVWGKREVSGGERTI